MNLRNHKNGMEGITLVALSITIIVLLIIAGISVYSGKDVIKRANLEELRTDMLLIEAKAKEYVENANFKLGIKIDEAADKQERINSAKQELKGKFIENTSEFGNIIGNNEEYGYYYQLNDNDLDEMGLSKVESNGVFIIKYDIKNLEVEVYNTQGFQANGQKYYSLTEIENLSI